MTDASRDSPVSHDPTGVNPPLDEQHAARELRRAGLTRREIARSLGMSTWRVTELLAGEPRGILAYGRGRRTISGSVPATSGAAAEPSGTSPRPWPSARAA
jgi:hypothetical protein